MELILTIIIILIVLRFWVFFAWMLVLFVAFFIGFAMMIFINGPLV